MQHAVAVREFGASDELGDEPVLGIFDQPGAQELRERRLLRRDDAQALRFVRPGGFLLARCGFASRLELPVEENPDRRLLPVQPRVKAGIDPARQGALDDELEGVQPRHSVAPDRARNNPVENPLRALGALSALAMRP